jgi:hypothetical protein
VGDVVNLNSKRMLDNDELIADLARFADGTLTEKAVKARHHLTDAEWASLGEDDDLVRACEAEKLRRIRTGVTKRERAQIEIVDAPPILGGIMRNPDSNARHIVDAIKTLDTLATDGRPEGTPASDRFVITINLGTDVLHFDKSIAIDPNDSSDTDTAPQGLLAVVAAKNPTENGGGNTL